MRIDPDIDLLPALRAGEPSAFTQLMDRHLRSVHGLAWHMLGDVSRAEDVSQETFLRFWQTAPSWTDGAATILTWLRKVATRICIDEIRRKAPIFTDDVPDVPDPSGSADRMLMADDIARRVRDALDRLPERQRAAIALSYYQDVSQRDGAAILDIGEKAYESLLSRARQQLKQDLMADRESLMR